MCESYRIHKKGHLLSGEPLSFLQAGKNTPGWYRIHYLGILRFGHGSDSAKKTDQVESTQSDDRVDDTREP